MKVHNPPGGDPERTLAAAARADCPAELSPADCRVLLARLRSAWAADLAAVATESVPDTDTQEGGE